MKLRDIVSALTTREVKVTVLDGGAEIIKFFSEGYAGVESEILDRDVSKWDITSASSISIFLAAVPNTTPTEPETNPTEP